MSGDLRSPAGAGAAGTRWLTTAVTFPPPPLSRAQVGLLVVAVGGVPVELLEGVLGAAESQLGTVVTEPLEGVTPTGSAGLYRVDANTLVCLAADAIAGDDATGWASALLRRTGAPKRVVVLTERPAFRYRSASPPDESVRTILRTVATDAAAVIEGGTAELEPPNVIDGAAAAVLTWCQARSVPARLYCSFRPHAGTMSDLDLDVFTTFLPALAEIASTGAMVKSDAEIEQYCRGAVRRGNAKAGDSLMYL